MITDNDLLKLREMVVDATDEFIAESPYVSETLWKARDLIDKLRETKYEYICLEHPCGDSEYFLLKNGVNIFDANRGQGSEIGYVLDSLGIEYSAEHELFDEEEYGDYEKAEDAFFKRLGELNGET